MAIPSDSILASVKKLLNIDAEDTSFDIDIITHINGTFMTLQQLGIGPKEGFFIDDYDTTWADFPVSKTMIHTVKIYIYSKVRMLFDTPGSSVVADAHNARLSELEFRLNVQAEYEQQEKENSNSEEEGNNNSSENGGSENQGGSQGNGGNGEQGGSGNHGTNIDDDSVVYEIQGENLIFHSGSPFGDYTENQNGN